MKQQRELPMPQDLSPPTPKPQSKYPMKESEEFAQLFVHILRAPMVVWPGYEEEFKDKWDKVLIQRLAHHQDFVEGMCTEYEAMLYISTATLVAPPRESWVRIYMYLFNRCEPEAARTNGLDDVKELHGSDLEDLMRLRRWAYKKQVLHLKEKGRAARQDALEQEREKVEAIQPELF